MRFLFETRTHDGLKSAVCRQIAPARLHTLPRSCISLSLSLFGHHQTVRHAHETMRTPLLIGRFLFHFLLHASIGSASQLAVSPGQIDARASIIYTERAAILSLSLFHASVSATLRGAIHSDCRRRCCCGCVYVCAVIKAARRGLALAGRRKKGGIGVNSSVARLPFAARDRPPPSSSSSL